MAGIQDTINQALGIAAVGAKTSTFAKNRAEALASQKAAKGAQAALADIESNAKAGKFSNYSDTQLKDVESRVGELNKTINDYRINQTNPAYKRWIGGEKRIKAENALQPGQEDRGVLRGSAYTSRLKTIEKGLNTAHEAANRAWTHMEDAQTAKEMRRSGPGSWSSEDLNG